MEEIAVRAEISRATVYSHYPNRDAIVAALLDEDWERQALRYLEFARSNAFDFNGVRRWLLREAANQRGGSRCFRLYSAYVGQNQEAFDASQQHRDRLMAILGEPFENFRIGKLRLATDRVRRMSALLMMFQIEQFCAHCAQAHAVIDARVGADLLAGKFLAFVEKGE